MAVWQLCGTAKSQLDSIGPLLLGRQGWHIAWRQSEWTGAFGMFGDPGIELLGSVYIYIIYIYIYIMHALCFSEPQVEAARFVKSSIQTLQAFQCIML